jgi:hypothetical protein
MIRTRILIPIIAFILAILITALAAGLPWIPEWRLFQIITAILGLLGATASMIFLLRGIWLQAREKMDNMLLMLIIVFTGMVTSGILFMAGLFTLFVIDGGLFAPVFKQKFAFPEYGITIYVYDSSFLDPEAQFRVRRSALPFALYAGTFHGYDAEHLTVEQEGEYAVFGDFKVHLPTGEYAVPYAGDVFD